MNTKISIDDILFMMKKVHADFIYIKFTEYLENQNQIQKFKYSNLKDQIETYKLTNTPFDITIHKIDDFMVDVYKSLINLNEFIRSHDDFFDNDENE